jgi:hypothetical protein
MSGFPDWFTRSLADARSCADLDVILRVRAAPAEGQVASHWSGQDVSIQAQ